MTTAPGPVAAVSAGSALGLGALAAMVAVVPAMARVESAGSLPLVWLALAGGSALVLGPLLVLLSGAWTDSRRVTIALAGVAASTAPVALLAALLKESTHHRPLGAATFAVLALLVVAFGVLLAQRIASPAGAPRAGRARGAVLVSVALGSLSAVLVAALGGDGARPHVLDGVSLLVWGGVAFSAMRVKRLVAVTRRIGPILWTTLTLAGLLAASGPRFAEMKKSAPVVSGPRAWL